MKITTGNVARHEDFFDREGLLKEIWDALESDSILLVAPRRVGKTSLMHRLIDLPERGFRTILLDGQNFSGPEDLVTQLAVEAGRFRGDAKRLFGSFFKGVEEMEFWQLRMKFREAMAGRWQAEGERAIRDVLEEGERVVMILDELPLLLHKMMEGKGDDGREKAAELLDWLRYLRMDKDLNGRLRQVIGGSIGLPRIASLMGASHKVNDLRPIPVAPLDADKARELARLLFASRNVSVDDEALDVLLQQVETFFPIFIQIMVSCICSEVREKVIPVTPQLVATCYKERALGPEYRLTFEDYYERLGRYYRPEDTRTAKRVLRELALASGPVSRSAVLGWYLDETGQTTEDEGLEMLLTWLEDDFYISETSDGELSFNVRWMKDWWRRHHGRQV